MDIKELLSEDLDWVEVIDVDLGGGYDWDEFHAWYSPSQRVFYYASDSGCSCNSFGMFFNTVSDFQVTTDRPTLMKAITEWFDQTYNKRPSELVEALHKINAFDVRKASETPDPRRYKNIVLYENE
ncbi:hypothetical protein SEA_MORRILL_21 [Microbacterium phage Morrill]|nr:hypothetical protein SEA_ATRAXI_21 [Microbacterium phage Atraxi]UQT01706.1 hypothetical protein SEA_MORRILL_21 [Microbacterium phage Morrill]